MSHWDLIVVGAGPAGLTAGIYGTYYDLKTLILEEKMPGGKAAEIPRIENLPGFPAGITGSAFVNNLLQQCQESGAEIHELEKVVELRLKSDIKVVKTEKAEYTADTVILASGSHPKFLQVPGEAKFRGRGVSYCAVCDGAFFTGKKVIVIGDGGPAACVAIYLSELASEVTLVHQRARLGAEKILVDDLKTRGVHVLSNTKLREIAGDGRVRRVVLVNVQTNATTEMGVDGVFFQVEAIPNSQCAQDAGVHVDEHGYIIVNESQKTNIDGVYAAGDVTTTPLKMIVRATGEASLAVKKLVSEAAEKIEA
jgi:thioredoxin reductase (NADPH)